MTRKSAYLLLLACPLTIYLLSDWRSTRFPGVDWPAHNSGYLLAMVFGWEANPHFGEETASRAEAVDRGKSECE